MTAKQQLASRSWEICLNKINTKFKDAFLYRFDCYTDERGAFQEIWKDKNYPYEFKQDSMSLSKKGVMRGLHFQNPRPQGKLVTVLKGSVVDVIVDLRQSSETFMQWEKFLLNEKDKTQLYVPEGFAHGFLALTKEVLFYYKCTEVYYPRGEKCLVWNDPDIGILWPKAGTRKYVISDKDRQGKKFSEFKKKELFE